VCRSQSTNKLGRCKVAEQREDGLAATVTIVGRVVSPSPTPRRCVAMFPAFGSHPIDPTAHAVADRNAVAPDTGCVYQGVKTWQCWARAVGTCR